MATEDCAAFGFDPQNPPALFHPDGCSHCNFPGYSGRTGIYELVEIDDPLRGMIHDGSGEHELEAHARKFSPSIAADGVRLALEGKTALEEVMRVIREG